MGFVLDKWYFDCVSPEGDALIGYAARVKWGVLRLGYGALLTTAPDGTSSQRQTPASGRVLAEPGSVSWNNGRLGAGGTWSEGTPIARTVVADGPSGSIEWECLGADCVVDVRVDDRAIRGSGYAEKLTMTIPPWRLPFREVRWGRYISDDRRHSMVWTELRGEAPGIWVWVDSSDAVRGSVDDEGVRTADSALRFVSSAPIRVENVADSLLGRFGFASALLPCGLRGIEEDKRLSACTLLTDGVESTGSAIHEVVRWT